MLYVGAAFIGLQVIFQFLEKWMENCHETVKRAKHGTFIAFVMHPTVVGGLHDLGVYVAGELPRLVFQHG